MDLTAIHWRDGDDDVYFDALAGGHWILDTMGKAMSVDGPCWARLGWVIAGGESGPRARPTHPDWARSLRDQGQAAGVPFFWKQWGEWAPANDWYSSHPVSLVLRSWNGSAWVEVEPDDDHYVARVGKKAAGRLLDGREWAEVPNG